MTAKDLIPFKKGDPRINRKGRPKSFDALRKLAVSLAHEEVEVKGGERVTMVEAILRQMARDPKQRALFLEYAFGKVPNQVDVTSGGEKIVPVTMIEIVKSDE